MAEQDRVETAHPAVMEAAPAAMLDNPIWSALTTDHAAVALGDEQARRYPAEIGPLSGMASPSEAGYDALRALADGEGSVVVVFLDKPAHARAGWRLVRDGVIDQMVASQPQLRSAALPNGVEMRALHADDAPAMVELAQLTEPGPFRLRTLALGSFFGILDAGRLLAMAGQRMRMPGFIEVSAVCTHPEARGRGYAGMLMSRVMEEIVRRGRVPFLHTYAHNRSAIRVYESLGFTRRRSFELAVLQREG